MAFLLLCLLVEYLAFRGWCLTYLARFALFVCGLEAVLVYWFCFFLLFRTYSVF